MKSVRFPNIFKGNSTQIVTGLDATKQNLKLLIGSEMGSLFGDPEFGVRLKRFVFDQNNNVLRDILIDEMYNKIYTFMPQIKVAKRDIKITRDRKDKKGRLTVTITALNKVDYTVDTYSLNLFQGE